MNKIRTYPTYPTYIGATTVGTGGDWPQILGWSPNFLAVVFKKQEISQQVVTRMQDLASKFSKNLPGAIPPNPHSRRSDPLPHPTPSPGFGRVRGACAPGVGTQTLAPSTFQLWLPPCPRIPAYSVLSGLLYTVVLA